MVLLPDSPSRLYVTFGLNNIVARDTRVEVRLAFLLERRHTNRIGQAKTTAADDSSHRSNSPSERLKNHVWPALKKGISTGLSEGSKMGRKRNDSQPSNAAVPSVSGQPKQIKKSASQSLSERREIALAELGIIPMMAGQEPRMDSPTIPGRLPVHGRSNSAPGSAANQTPFERSIQEPISEPLILSSQTNHDSRRVPAKSEEPENRPRSQSADESVTSPASKNQPPTVPEEDDKPPAVPPKSPRLIYRPVAPLSNEIGGSLTRSNSAANGLRPRAATAMGIRPRRHIAELHRRNESTPTTTTMTSRCQQSKPNQRMAKLKHEAGESAIQCQDRTKRRRSLRVHRTSKHVEKTNFAQLPVGFNLPDAKSQFTSSDVEKLREQAKTQAEKFKVLQYHEVKALSKELRSLDIRVDYLRNTSKALRAGRNHLHERVIAHLRSSRSANNSRENILGQEEALAQLDKSIDEWITKLEQVDNRRARVRQMLLEHIAASLVLSATYDTQGETRKQLDSPIIKDECEVEVAMDALDIELDDVASVTRESIKIYADYGVYGDGDMATLLADIERQMETMKDSRRPPSFAEYNIVA
ncbi:conserved hypothetical protein [Talaromyces stipitatus ATCC 10500]|uniref:Up-regulated during septation protein 1 domain-containing protein n=1 Tax=Talaromyces stipitatus (strain ATCC 10500 / CBS 375.48 / QM 6759 / NRRL 1006) TaxID=441959 RepID=B8M3P1_TALSN|nr:uncharacterized protein TSTA_096620 [Talaromyces stipitatus ATCC 10500]EED22413.1 conserved hypothetical protein [Talaromyces stipitatus ATCC 10500]